MKVKIKGLASFRDLLGSESSLQVESGSTVENVLQKLSSDNRRFRETAFDESGKLRDFVKLMKNKKIIESSEADSIELAEGDELAIFPPVAGG